VWRFNSADLGAGKDGVRPLLRIPERIPALQLIKGQHR